MKIINRVCLGFIGAMGVPALVLWMPGGSDLLVGWATASPQPALVASLPEPISVVSAHSGDGQAQGRGR